jgi:hypothetical protein
MHRRSAVLLPLVLLLILVPVTTFAASLTVDVTIANSDPTQAGRLVRTNVMSSCNSDKTCPGVFDSTPRHYQSFALFNESASASCTTFSATSSGNLYWVAYFNSFDPNNLCANYAADLGTTAVGGSSASVIVPAYTTLVLVVHELTPNTGGSGTFTFSNGSAVRAEFMQGLPSALLRNPTDGQNAAVAVSQFAGNFGNRPKVFLPGLPDTNWNVGGVGFFGGTTGTDIAWHNVSTGQNAFWIMNRASLTSVQNLPGIPNTALKMVGSGDFNHDGNMDLLWRNSATGDNAMWLVNGTTVSSVVDLPGLPDAAWTVVGAGDIDLDAWADIVWYNTTTGDVALWKMNGTSYVSTINLGGVADLAWRPKAVLDASGDGNPDIIWENVGLSQMTAWVMHKAVISSVMSLNTGEPKNGRVVVGPR